MKAVYRGILRLSGVSVIAALAAITLGCGSGATVNTNAGEQVVIHTQPASQTIPIGETATFTVAVSGAVPMTYQWSRNGVPIEGGTAATYTTPSVSAGDTGSTFTVTVSDSFSSATSSAAALTAGPRSPRPGDLRFQQVDAPSVANMGTDDIGFGLESGTSQWRTNAVGFPLELGPENCIPGMYRCGWSTLYFPLPQGVTGLTAYYQSNGDQSFPSQMGPVLAQPNVVLTTLDFQPGSFAYAAGWIETSQGGGFDCRQEVVPPSQIQPTAAQDGAQSRVITAASFDGQGQVNFFSYGWQGDTTTVYESQATIVTGAQNAVAAATALASQGYIVTAFGRNNSANDYVLVGTRVKGDTLPRPTITDSQNSQASVGQLLGYAPVLDVMDSAAGLPWAYVYEK